MNSNNPNIFPFEFSINSIDGTPINLHNYKGKNILFVNVAQNVVLKNNMNLWKKLSKKYKKDLVVIGCPSNQFGQQEPGTHPQR